MNLTEIIEAIQAGAFATAELRPVPGHDSIAYSIGQGGQLRLVDLQHIAERPTAKRGTFTLTAPSDFAAYVIAHAGDGTAVFVEPRKGVAVAVIDGHGTAPGHGQHTATMSLQRSAAWDRITRHVDTTISQEQFANWLDDIRDEVEGLDTDELLELIDNLHVFASSSQKEVRATSHGKSIAFAEDVTIKAGKAGVDLPNKLTVRSTAFEGVDKAWRFEIRLSVVASPGQPTKFRLAIPRRDDVLEAATGEAMAVVSTELNGLAPIYAGRASHAAAPAVS